MAFSVSIQTLLVAPNRPSSHVLFGNSVKLGQKSPIGEKKMNRKCRVMAQQTAQGPSAAFAQEMERNSAKESLLLAFKDAGGFDAFVTGKITNVERIDVNERIVSLERLNPTPRPTMSPHLEGRWNFEWFGSGSPALYALQFLIGRSPPALANISKLDVAIKDGYANISANVKLLNSIESSFVVSTRLSVEGPLRMKEEYIEGIFEAPKVNEEAVPERLRGAFRTMQQLPVTVRDAVASGFKLPLGGTFERLFLISYLDDEIMITRDTTGVPEVLTRLDFGSSLVFEPISEYES